LTSGRADITMPLLSSYKSEFAFGQALGSGAFTATPSRSAILQARLAAALVVGLIVVGALWYGISFESLDRLWKDMRWPGPGGPMTFRFILQPAMAAAMAYLWALLRGVRARRVMSASVASSERERRA
jgi:hypothetical protein